MHGCSRIRRLFRHFSESPRSVFPLCPRQQTQGMGAIPLACPRTRQSAGMHHPCHRPTSLSMVWVRQLCYPRQMAETNDRLRWPGPSPIRLACHACWQNTTIEPGGHFFVVCYFGVACKVASAKTLQSAIYETYLAENGGESAVAPAGRPTTGSLLGGRVPKRAPGCQSWRMKTGS